jgi:BirA family biotin operon repressor/biotin-[acetyl-CoA-carboxylase] ligase
VIDQRALKALVPIGAMGIVTEFYPSIGSTNDRAAELAKEGSPHGTLIIAEEQTAGRGRAGSRWWTNKKAGLALSVVLRPKGQTSVGMLTGLGAVAASEAIEQLGGDPKIKWPNDVLLGDKKVAGILAEGAWTADRLEYAVLGIGVNVRSESLPPSASFPATSLDDEMGHEVNGNALLASILRRLDWWSEQLPHPDLIAAWEKRLAYVNKSVAYDVGAQGVIVGLSSEGELILNTAGGSQVKISAGEYHLRLVDMDKE